MIDKKKTGSYYTPKILSDFLSVHVYNKYLNNTPLSILEPSCGDGRFISSLCNTLKEKKKRKYSIDLFDIDRIELDKAVKHIPQRKLVELQAYEQDYLQAFLKEKKQYSLIIGNPPYINKKNMDIEQIEICEKVHNEIKNNKQEIKSVATIKNIWTAFVEATILSLNDSGVLCLVIPAEILQVKYASELRALISNEFDRVEIFAFNELIFEGIQQDVVALIGVKGVKNKRECGFSFYQVEKLVDLKEPLFTEKHANINRTSLDKWTNYILSDSELSHIETMKSGLKPIKDYCKNSEVGIVSAANDFFIISKEELSKNGFNKLKSVVKPILSKGYMVSHLSKFTLDDFEALQMKNKKVNFLNFPDLSKPKLGKIANNYIKIGEELNLHKRYKMLRRTNWYHVPCTWKSEALFIKRSHTYPKIFVNEAEVLATDSFYRVQTHEHYDIKHLVFSFYNSLTFVLSELEGRFYGGGVLELTPNEFKNLSIPYHRITDEQFNTLDNMLRNRICIDEILAFTNPILFSKKDITRLEVIRKKLVCRRLKKTIEPNSSTEVIPFVERTISPTNIGTEEVEISNETVAGACKLNCVTTHC